MLAGNKMQGIRKNDLKGSCKTRIDEILDQYGRRMEALLPCLEIIQEAEGYITQEAVSCLRDDLNIPAATIYSVATFYGMLTTKKQGKYVVRLCNSVSCNLNASLHVLRIVENELGIKHGETTDDHQFTLEVVACLGLCDKAPAMMVNDGIYDSLTEESIKFVFSNLKGTG